MAGFKANPVVMAKLRDIGEVGGIFLKLGCMCFGGAVAHFGYLHEEFVRRRQWLDEAHYSDLVALCNFLPGPASSQLVFAIGMRRAGLAGALVASLAFMLPSAILMILFGYGLVHSGATGENFGWLHGLQLAAVAVVAQAVWTMGRRLCPDRERILLALAAAIVVWALPGAWGQIGVLAAGAAVGYGLQFTVSSSRLARMNGPSEISNLKSEMRDNQIKPAPANLETRYPKLETENSKSETLNTKLETENDQPKTANRKLLSSHYWAAGALIVFAALLVILPAVATATGSKKWAVFAGIYRAGALVFGGGHVLLPLLQAAVVPPGWIGDKAFLAGYGASQALPGPLFTFTAYLGTVIFGGRAAWLGGLFCLFAVYLPGWLVIGGALPFWQLLRQKTWAQGALRGASATVVGILLAALYHPVASEAITSWRDAAAAVVGFALLQGFRTPPWLVVILAAAAGQWILR